MMSKYNVDGVILDTARATATWDEATRWDGRNHISLATGSQWEHETLYLSAKGRYWIEHTSQWQGSTDTAELVTDYDAASWLLRNEHELPPNLAHLESEVSE